MAKKTTTNICALDVRTFDHAYDMEESDLFRAAIMAELITIMA